MSAKRRTVYTHTGWRKIGGQWTYLHQGGAVGTEGVSVDLESSLANYTLNGCDDLEPGEAARQSLMVRKCISDRLAVPLLVRIHAAGVVFSGFRSVYPRRNWLPQVNGYWTCT